MVHVMERLNFIAKKIIHGPLFDALSKWKSFVVVLKNIRRKIAARSIQREYKEYYQTRVFKFNSRIKNFIKIFYICRNKHKNATRIQCMHRCFIARKKVKCLRIEKTRNQAATRIQSIYRGWKQRTTVIKLIRLEKEKEEEIQTQRQIQMQIEIERQVQVLRILEANKAANNNLLVIKIQSAWRGRQARKQTKVCNRIVW